MLPGHRYIPMSNGTAGMNADPSCNRHAIFPTWYTARLADEPLSIPSQRKRRPGIISKSNMNIPKETHSCQPMTKLPLMEAGEFSAANTGIVDALVPIPIPSNKRQANSCCHVWVNAEPMTDVKQKIAETNIVPLRPIRWFNG